MGNDLQDLKELEEVLKNISYRKIKLMDTDNFMALVVVLIDAHTRVTDLASNEEMSKELSKDYVDDFLISLRDYMGCRENFAKRVLKERIERLSNGRC